MKVKKKKKKKKVKNFFYYDTAYAVYRKQMDICLYNWVDHFPPNRGDALFLRTVS